MTDNTEALIRKAVELADGWDIEVEGSADLWAVHTGYYDDRWEIHLSEPERYQPSVDALAAQLVRQVDAICQCDITAETVTIREVWKPRLGYAEGPDRTLNTIKAIVESGVLE